MSAEKYVCASKSIPVINGLIDVLEELKKKPEYYDAVKHVIQNIESQLNARFLVIENEDNLAMCTILDPRFKLSMFIDENAATTTKTNVVTEVKNVMRQTESISQPVNFDDTSNMDDGEVSIWRKRNLILKQRKANPMQNISNLAQQEMESYLQEDFADSKCDPCQWWRSNQFK